MNTLDAAFQNADLIFGIYVAIILVSGLFAPPGRRRGAMAIAVINHGGLIGLAALLVIPFISPFAVDVAQLMTGLFIEVFCAFVFFMSSLQIIKFLRTKAKIVPDRILLLLILLKLFSFIANYIASGGQYGIFSDDSRIDFLRISPLIARFWYLDIIIDFIMILSTALRFIEQKIFRLRDWLSLLAIISFTFLSGSKGSTFLLIAYAILFTYVAFPRRISLIPLRTIFFIISIISSIIFGYVYILSELLHNTVGEQISLTLSRFLLSADARIMALDPNINAFVLSQPHGSFLSELFRGYARILGLPTAEYPIGIYQYKYQVGATNYVGSTNQLSAMFIIYGGYFWLIEFITVGSLVLFTYEFLRYSMKSNKTFVPWVAAASVFYLSDSLCKGFDAFVQMQPICVLLIVILMALPRIRWTPRLVTCTCSRGLIR